MSMFATLGSMLSPRMSPRCDGGEGPVQPRKPATLRDFGSMLPRPTNQQSPVVGGFRSPRTSVAGSGPEPQQRAPRRSTGGYPGASPATGAAAPLSARLRERGGVTRDGRDAYDLWYGVQSGEKKPQRSSRKSTGGSVAHTVQKTPEEIRDGFEMFYGIGQKADAGSNDATDAKNRVQQPPSIGTAPAPNVSDGAAAGGVSQATVSISSAAAAVSAGVAAAAQQLQPQQQADAPANDVSRQEWLRQVNALEAQLQATLALGPDGTGTAPCAANGTGQLGAPTGATQAFPREGQEQVPGPSRGPLGRPPPPCRVAPPPAAQANDDRAHSTVAGHLAAPGAAQVFSVCTPSAPSPPPLLSAVASPTPGAVAAANASEREEEVRGSPDISVSPTPSVPALDLGKVNSPER